MNFFRVLQLQKSGMKLLNGFDFGKQGYHIFETLNKANLPKPLQHSVHILQRQPGTIIGHPHWGNQHRAGTHSVEEESTENSFPIVPSLFSLFSGCYHFNLYSKQNVIFFLLTQKQELELWVTVLSKFHSLVTNKYIFVCVFICYYLTNVQVGFNP